MMTSLHATLSILLALCHNVPHTLPGELLVSIITRNKNVGGETRWALPMATVGKLRNILTAYQRVIVYAVIDG